MEVYRISLFGEFFNQVTVTTFHYLLATTVAGNRHQALIQAFNAHQAPGAGGSIFARFVASCTADWRATHIRSVRVHRDLVNRSFGENIYVVQNVGTQLVPTLPPQDTIVISRRGMFAVRFNYGRIFVPAVPQTHIDDGRVTQPSPYATALSALRDSLLVRITGNDVAGNAMSFDPVLVRRTRVGSSGPYTILWKEDGNPTVTMVATGLVDDIVRSQRRRQLGRGV